MFSYEKYKLSILYANKQHVLPVWFCIEKATERERKSLDQESERGIPNPDYADKC